ncbi:MAG TPA: hypothetical protein VGE98_09080 [Thermoanaerobaculia bacterium]
MAESHLTRHLLRAVAVGDLPPRVLVDLGWTHLLELCPECRREVAAWRDEQKRSSCNYESTFAALPDMIAQRSRQDEEERAVAERDFAELRRLSAIERRERVKLARRRFHSARLGMLLLDQARQRVAADAEDSYLWAELAEMVAERSRDDSARDVLLLAQVHCGNALRVMSNVRGADARFRQARALLRDHGAADTTVFAEVDWYEGALRRDQRRFEEAEGLLSRASMQYRMAGEHATAARPLLTLGLLYHEIGDNQSAIEATELAMRSIPQTADRRFFLSARHNLALFVCEGGNPTEAAEMLRGDLPLYADFPDAPTQMRLSWLKGKIAAGLDQTIEAEDELRRARDGFLELGIGYDAALASLDLALLYSRQQRTGELKQLAEEIAPIFEARDIHRETVAALALFQRAAQQEAVTAEAIGRLGQFLRESRNNPALHLRRPS